MLRKLTHVSRRQFEAALMVATIKDGESPFRKLTYETFLQAVQEMKDREHPYVCAVDLSHDVTLVEKGWISTSAKSGVELDGDMELDEVVCHVDHEHVVISDDDIEEFLDPV